MPKLKTRRGAAKRFTITAKGKVKRRKGFLRHILSNKTKKQKRHLRRATLVDKADERAIKRLLPYGTS
jgi:large subunit ribosomal protein L35